MKKLLLTLLTTLMLTGAAWAEWVKVAQSDIIDKYIDPATIRKNGNLVRVWEIHNHKKRDKDGKLSLRARAEYDCKQERFRALSVSEHSGPMASGTTLLSDSSDNQWQDIPPNTFAEDVLKIVCAK